MLFSFQLSMLPPEFSTHIQAGVKLQTNYIILKDLISLQKNNYRSVHRYPTTRILHNIVNDVKFTSVTKVFRVITILPKREIMVTELSGLREQQIGPPSY